MANIKNLRDQGEALLRDTLQRRRIYFNGNTWETELEQLTRYQVAMVHHLNSLEERYADLENRLNMHAQGVTHRPTKRIPKADES